MQWAAVTTVKGSINAPVQKNPSGSRSNWELIPQSETTQGACDGKTFFESGKVIAETAVVPRKLRATNATTNLRAEKSFISPNYQPKRKKRL
jgi:hypothetical protein